MWRFPGSKCERMAKEVYGFPDDLKRMLSTDVSLDLPSEVDSIALCGMGASSIGGDAIGNCVSDRLDIPISVLRGTDLPGWVGKNTLVIVSSYSGNTYETNCMYDQAIRRGCSRLVVTSGGKIKDKCQDMGDPLLELIPGVQPRSALGQTIGLLSRYFDSTFGTRISPIIAGALPFLYDLRDRLVTDGGEAEDIAKKIGYRIPVIYSANDISSAALRWKTQINENSKTVAFSGSIPEFNYNELAAWSRNSRSQECVPIILRSTDSDMDTVFEDTILDFEDLGATPIVTRIPGRASIHRLLYSILLGDYVSLYLAEMKGVDPEEVDTIKSLKARMVRKLNV